MWRFGWFLNTLNYQIEKNLRDSIYVNETYKQNSWNLIEKQFLLWAQRPIYYAFFIAFLIPFTSLAIYMWSPDLINLFPEARKYKESILDWQVVLLGAQLTIIGLIFPLVIGFVGILIQNASANRALWEMYRRYSSFMFIGMSGVALSVVIILIEITNPWMTDKVNVIFTLGLAGWLIFNIISIGWLIHATVVFISIKKRSEVINRFVINDVLITEIRERLAIGIPQTIIERGIIPANSINTIISTIDWPHGNEKIFEKNYKNNKNILNIYFRFIQFGVYIWRKRNQSKDNEPELILPIHGRTNSSKKWKFAICRNCEFTTIEKFIFYMAYRLGKNKPIDKLEINIVLNALVSDIEDAIQNKNYRLFETSLNEMKEWQIEIMKSASFKNDVGNKDNWLLMPDGTFFGTSILNELMQEYYQVHTLSVDKLPKSTQFFQKLSYFYPHIYGYQNDYLPSSVSTTLITAHSNLWSALMYAKDTQSNTAEYDSTFKHFVGSWENWGARLPREKIEWENSQDMITLQLHHLQYTAYQMIVSLRTKNNEAACWSADMLSNWYKNNSSTYEAHQYRWKSELIPSALIGDDIDSPLWGYLLNQQDINEKDAIYIALKNAWSDIRVISAAYVLNKPDNDFQLIYKKIILSLFCGLKCQSVSTIAELKNHLPHASLALQVYLKYTWSFKQVLKNSIADGLVEKFGQVDSKNHVPGRVYSGWGSSDVSSLQHMLMVLTLGCSSYKWSLSRDFMDFVLSSNLEELHRESLIRDLESWLDVEGLEEETKNLFELASVEEKLVNYKESIQDIIVVLKDHSKRIIQDAEIDQNRLDAFAIACSQSAFNSQSENMPIHLFSHIKYVEDLDNKFIKIHNITNFHKKDVAQNVEISRAINENDWLDDLMQKRVTGVIFSKLLQHIKEQSRVFETPQQIVQQIITDSKLIIKKGLKPILFISDWKIQSFLEEVLWNEDSTLPFVLRQDDGYPNEYICHLEDIAVYRFSSIKPKSNVLLVKELFDTVTIKKISENKYVNAVFNPDTDNELEGTLELSFWMDVKFNDYTSYKYILLEKIDDFEDDLI